MYDINREPDFCSSPYEKDMLNDLVNLLQYDDGLFLKYSGSRKLDRQLKINSFPVEFGQNNLL